MAARWHTPHDVTAVILAGGQSTRFGQDKASALLGGRPLVDVLAARLRPQVAEVLAVARPEQQTQAWRLDRVLYDDVRLPPCPLRGVAAGLAGCATPLALVVACDTPLFAPSWVPLLAEQMRPGVQLVLPRHGCRLQPLAGLWRRDALDAVLGCLQQGRRAVLAAVDVLRHVVVEEDDLRAAADTPLAFASLNHAGELQALAARWCPRASRVVPSLAT